MFWSPRGRRAGPSKLQLASSGWPFLHGPLGLAVECGRQVQSGRGPSESLAPGQDCWRPALLAVRPRDSGAAALRGGPGAGGLAAESPMPLRHGQGRRRSPQASARRAGNSMELDPRPGRQGAPLGRPSGRPYRRDGRRCGPGAHGHEVAKKQNGALQLRRAGGLASPLVAVPAAARPAAAGTSWGQAGGTRGPAAMHGAVWHSG